MANVFKKWLGVKVDAEGEKDVFGDSMNAVGNAIGVYDPNSNLWGIGHSHGVNDPGHNHMINAQYQNAINQQAMQQMMNTASAASAPTYSGFRTDIEPTEDGFVVTVYRRYGNGVSESVGKKFIASDIEEATQKIAAGIALFKLDDSNKK